MDVVKREVDIRLPGTSSDRSVGRIHVSDILSYIGRETGVLDLEDKFTPRSTRFRLALGLAWEEYLASQYPEIHFHPGEFEKDGIVGSPDGLSECPDGTLAIDEFKLTWLSARWQLTERTNRMRIWQVLAYCHLLELRKVNLWVGYVNGDYNRQGPKVYAPDPVIYEIEFTNKEVGDNWRMMTNNVPSMLRKWEEVGWWEGDTEDWVRGGGRVTQKKIEESDIYDLDTLEDAISA